MSQVGWPNQNPWQLTNTTQPNRSISDPTGPTPSPQGPGWQGDPQFQGMDPLLQQIYQRGNLSPAGRGTGFADWQYWQGVGPSQYNRLTADIAGTGTDQPTGTPGTGPWQSSGKGQAQGQGQQQGAGVSNQADQILAMLEGNTNGIIQQLMQQGQGQGGQGQGGV